MKYAVIIPDGCADEPQDSLGAKTPLEAACLPAMDSVAAAGIVGTACHTPAALPAGSDVANLSLFGYDPLEFFTGRAPLEAAAQGIALGSDDWAVRCNLVTIVDQVMRDFTAGHIPSSEASQLIEALQHDLGSERMQFHAGVSYRNLLIRRGAGSPAAFSRDTQTVPPHDLTDQSVADSYPRGPGGDLLCQWMDRSEVVLADHPVNAKRKAEGRLPATHAWLWGLGSAPRLPAFVERYGVRGVMITAVDLLRGLAATVGWNRIEVAGATGYVDTDYAAKGRAAVAAMADYDLVCVHVEAPDEASHEGDAAAKVKALEEIDRHIVAPVFEAIRAHGEFRILVSPDHPTPLRTKTHSHGRVPWAMAGAGIAPDAANAYDDRTAARSGEDFAEGWKLMGRFLGK
jgi:2,3-bisphosphoglycerate-independent phosphoglycerate mutase